MTYAERFGRPPPGLSGGLVISPVEGLRFLHEPVTLERLRGWADVPIDAANPRFTRPLVRARRRSRAGPRRAAPASCCWAAWPPTNTSSPCPRSSATTCCSRRTSSAAGDMSRGALLLRAARAGQELAYAPVEGARRHGPRAPRLAQRARPGGEAMTARWPIYPGRPARRRQEHLLPPALRDDARPRQQGPAAPTTAGSADRQRRADRRGAGRRPSLVRRQHQRRRLAERGPVIAARPVPPARA